jgi:DNA-binding MarR family transcriptional regulator
MNHQLRSVKNSNHEYAELNPSVSDIGPRDLVEGFAALLALKNKVDLVAGELGRICHIPAPDPIPPRERVDNPVDLEINNRARRGTILPPRLFSEPAWDILLALYRAELHHRRVSISRLCIASQVPTTTVLRWIGTLGEEGLVRRDPDPFDLRRFYVSLTASGSSAMSLYFSTEPSGESEK